MSDSTRIEHDLLGDKEMPNSYYYGVQTQRAVENFKITDIPLAHFPQFVSALALVKMEPVIAFNMLQSMRMLTRAMDVLADRCIRGITANVEHCRELVTGSIGVVTALNPYIGYQNSTRIAKLALESGDGVAAIVLREKLLSEEKLTEILKPENMTKPRRIITQH